jgi:hypothetical protein
MDYRTRRSRYFFSHAHSICSEKDTEVQSNNNAVLPNNVAQHVVQEDGDEDDII